MTIKHFLGIFLFDAFRSPFKIRSKPAEWFLNFMNKRAKNKFKENPELPKNYTAEFIKRADSKNHKRILVIAFAHNVPQNLMKYIKNYDSLHIALNPAWVYYMLDVERLCSYIKKIILENGYNKVILTGSSKGGTASLMYSSLMAHKCKFVQFYAIAFAPQVVLYPVNHHFSNGNYIDFKNNLAKNKALLKNAQKYGDFNKLYFKKRNNLKVYCIAGKRSYEDASELYKFYQRKNVTLFFLDSGHHFVIFNFFLQAKHYKNVEKLKNFLRYTSEDMGASWGERWINALVNEITTLANKFDFYTLNELFDILVTKGQIKSLYKDIK